MKVLLPDALHARPANLLVRLAAQHSAVVRLQKGDRCADARKILDVLSLGAAKGEEIEIFAEGDGAEGALLALAELVARNFDADLVPERGSGAVEGIAIGRALVIPVLARTSATQAKTRDEERARLDGAEARALVELEALIAVLSPDERALFEPERAIVREVAEAAAERVERGEAETCEAAVMALTESAPTDLIIDARARLLEALAQDEGTVDALGRAAELGEDVIVVAEVLTPSLVAHLPPRVRGLVAVDDEPDAGYQRTSHAAILARGREIPLALVPSHVAMAITEGDVVVVDTTDAPARVWVAPSASLVEDARARRSRRSSGGLDSPETVRALEGVSAALGVAFLVNVGSLHDRVPEGAAGVGLLRTELLFAGRGTAPSENDQVAALLAIARLARGTTVTARLWDAGGDKPLAWLPAKDASARGAELLFAHRAVLETQLAAIARAATRSPIRALVPMTRSAHDVDLVRAWLTARGAAVPVGAMIETPGAAHDAEAIAKAADFVCIGTNDLASLVLGAERTEARQALDPRVLALIARVVDRAHACGRRVTVCGEVAADPTGACILVGLGVDALSVAPPRLADTVRGLERATLAECRAAARASGREPMAAK